MKEILKDYLPFIGVGFLAGFATGIVINLWCLVATLP